MNSEELIYCKLLEKKEFLEAKVDSLNQKIVIKEAEIDELIKKIKQKFAEIKPIC